MEVIHEKQGPVDVFRISGRLDYSATAGDLDDRLRAPVKSDPNRRFPVLDLSGVTMLGSQALRGILSLAKDLKGQSGTVFVAAPSDAAIEALKLSGFAQLKIFEQHATLKDAVLAATLAAKKAPALKTDDPFYIPPEPPPPPPPPTAMEVAVDKAKQAVAASLPVAKKAASVTLSASSKAWNWLALQIQKLLEKKPKK